MERRGGDCAPGKAVIAARGAPSIPCRSPKTNAGTTMPRPRAPPDTAPTSTNPPPPPAGGAPPPRPPPGAGCPPAPRAKPSGALGAQHGGGGGVKHPADGVGERGGHAVDLGRGLAAELSDRLLQRVHPVHAAVRVVETAAT